jgi:hypothetical protein
MESESLKDSVSFVTNYWRVNMLKFHLKIFLQTMSEGGIVDDKHVDIIHEIMGKMTNDTMEKFVAYDLYKDLLLKEKQNAEKKKPT